ncbi:MAG: ferredoxin [Proteobacteria bacterium]|jgi:ferredoxin|nr:ferredoxin [Pseudomonadota bacterium]
MARIPYVDQDECTGCGMCEEICPDVFHINDDGISEIQEPHGATAELIQEAIDECPVNCISWEEE